MTLWTPQIGLVLALALPLLGFVAILALGRRPELRDSALLAAGVALALNIVPLVMAVGGGARPALTLAEIAPGMSLGLALEPLGALFAGAASLLWVVNSAFSIAYMRANAGREQTRFHAFFALAVAATMGVALAGDMLTLFVFYEALTLSTYPLVAHKGGDAARRGARIYLLILLSTSLALLLPAIVVTAVAAGSTSFTPGGLLAKAGAGATVTGALLLLYAFGIGKAALMPVHAWLPSAMVAPTPVSALLHAVAVVTAGVFAMLKVSVYIIGPGIMAAHPVADAIAVVAGVSIVLASLVAFMQGDLKARLAWSTVSQLSFVTLGAMLAAPWALMGAALQMLLHPFAKIALFMWAGAFTTATGLKHVADTRGFGRALPLAFGAALVAAVSLAGLPPLAGMWPKLFLAAGAAQDRAYWAFAVLAASSVLNVAYLVAPALRGFFAPRAEAHAGVFARAPLALQLAPALAAAACVLFFFLIDPIAAYIAPALGTPP